MEWKERYESNEDTEVFAIFIENRLTDDETFDIFFYRFPISRLSSVKPHFLSLFLSLSIFVHKTVLSFTHSSQALGYAFPTETVCILPMSPFSLCLATFHSLLSLRLSLRFPASLLANAVFLSFPSYLLTLSPPPSFAARPFLWINFFEPLRSLLMSIERMFASIFSHDRFDRI